MQKCGLEVADGEPFEIFFGEVFRYHCGQRTLDEGEGASVFSPLRLFTCLSKHPCCLAVKERRLLCSAHTAPGSCLPMRFINSCRYVLRSCGCALRPKPFIRASYATNSVRLLLELGVVHVLGECSWPVLKKRNWP